MRLWTNRRVLFLVLASVFLSMTVGTSFASYSAIVSVYPSPQSVKVGQIFTVDIRVENITGLQCVDFCLKYDSTMLNATKVEEGSFMKAFGSTYIIKQEIQRNYQTNRGRVWFVDVITGNGSATGSGTLATVTFNATAPSEGVLDLFSVLPESPNQVKIITCGGVPIAHAVIDGYVVVSSDPADPPGDPPGQSDPAVQMSPDLNGDGIVDIVDVSMIARAYGKSSGDPLYALNADLDQDGVIGIKDLAVVASKFGQTL
jgi:hypothetical protein